MRIIHVPQSMVDFDGTLSLPPSRCLAFSKPSSSLKPETTSVIPELAQLPAVKAHEDQDSIPSGRTQVSDRLCFKVFSSRARLLQALRSQHSNPMLGSCSLSPAPFAYSHITTRLHLVLWRVSLKIFKTLNFKEQDYFKPPISQLIFWSHLPDPGFATA